jgi:hypothetical protein
MTVSNPNITHTGVGAVMTDAKAMRQAERRVMMERNATRYRTCVGSGGMLWEGEFMANRGSTGGAYGAT